MLNLLKSRNLNQLFSNFLGMIIFFFFFAPKSIGLFTVLLIVFTIFLVIKKEVKFVFNKINFILFSIYILYLFGMFFSDNFDLGLKYLEYKLVLLIFPLVFSFKFKENISLKPTTIGLIFGLFVGSILGIINSYKVFVETNDFNNSFGSTNFSYIHHPTYFSAFLLIGMAFFYNGFIKKWKLFNIYTLILFCSFSIIMQFFCFSFAGLMFLLLLFVFLLIRIIFLKTKRVIFFSSLVFVPVLLVVIYKSNVHIQIEIDGVKSSLQQYFSNPKKILQKDESTLTGNDSRLIMWTVTFEEILIHPFGVGTGDIDSFLTQRLNKYNLRELAKKNYNPHNQFLQITLEIGLLGLFFLILFFTSSINLAFKHKNWILLLVCLNLFFNCLFESMLQRQSGIVFFVFFILILVSSSTVEKLIPENK